MPAISTSSVSKPGFPVFMRTGYEDLTIERECYVLIEWEPEYYGRRLRVDAGANAGTYRQQFAGYRLHFTLRQPVAYVADWVTYARVYKAILEEGVDVELKPWSSDDAGYWDTVVLPDGPLLVKNVQERKPLGMEIETKWVAKSLRPGIVTVMGDWPAAV